MKQLEIDFVKDTGKDKPDWNDDEKRVFQDKITDMAIVEKIGHDKRGNTLYRRDKDGNEIMVPEKQTIIKIDEVSSGAKTAQMESRERVVDDQTTLVPAIFQEWKIHEGISSQSL